MISRLDDMIRSNEVMEASRSTPLLRGRCHFEDDIEQANITASVFAYHKVLFNTT